MPGRLLETACRSSVCECRACGGADLCPPRRLARGIRRPIELEIVVGRSADGQHGPVAIGMRCRIRFDPPTLAMKGQEEAHHPNVCAAHLGIGIERNSPLKTDGTTEHGTQSTDSGVEKRVPCL